MKQITTPHLAAMKARGEKIAMVTAYDHTFSRILNQAQVEIVLVGDSLGMVIQGHDSTLPVTMEEMVYHTRIVARGAAGPLVVADMPFMSYQASREQALVNAGRLMKEGMAGAVKLEGGVEMADTIRAIAQAGIPVMGHVGLRPQSVHQYGGFKIQGRKVSEADRILADAQAVAEAGAFALVIEGVPADLAARITESLPIPTIGIGAGAGCDGQVLVIYDLLGMDNSFNPKFAKKYAQLHDTILDAVQQYVGEVKSGAFPGPEHAF